MRIEQVVVEAFKGLQDGSHDLSPGLTVVRGPNEAGKSSLQQAILAGLFGDAGSSAQRWSYLHSWQAGRKCYVRLRLEMDGRQYDLLRDFESRRQELTPLDGGAVVSGRDQVRDRLAQLAGLSSESAYTATACLRQQDLAKLQAGTELNDMLQRTITGSDDDGDVSEALKKLQRELNDKFRRGSRGGEKGLWLAANEDLTQARESQARTREEVSRTVRAREIIAAHADECEQKKSELDEKRALLARVQEHRDKQQQHEELVGKCSDLQKRIEQARKLGEAIALREQELEKLPETDSQVADRLRQAAERQGQLDNEIDQAEQRTSGLQAREQELSQARAQAETAMARRRNVGIVLALSVLVAAVSLWQGLSGMTVFWAVLAVATVVAGVSAAMLMSARSTSRVRDLDAQISSLQGQRSTLDEHLQTLQSHRGELERTVTDGLQQAQMDSVDQYVQVAKQRRQITEQNQADGIRLEGTLGGAELGQLDERLGALNLDRRALAQELESPEMLAAEMSADQMRELEGEIQRLEQEVPRLNEMLRDARAAIAQSRFDVEDETRADEQVAALQERVDRLAEYEQVLTLAAEVMEEARRQSMHSAVDTLGPTIKQYLGALTGGRYQEVEIRGDELTPAVYSQDKSDFVDPETELSLATKEQLYLAWRLALAGLLWPDDAPPVLLDDPLVNFDEPRKDYALDLLRTIAETRQVVLFTCSDEYDEAADTVIRLQGP